MPHLTMFTAKGTIVPWLASQTDMLANDWQIYEPDVMKSQTSDKGPNDDLACEKGSKS